MAMCYRCGKMRNYAKMKTAVDSGYAVDHIYTYTLAVCKKCLKPFIERRREHFYPGNYRVYVLSPEFEILQKYDLSALTSFVAYYRSQKELLGDQTNEELLAAVCHYQNCQFADTLEN